MLPAGQRGQKGMRMKELVQATGVSKSAILHYLHEGLLPQPVKTSPNMAYYAPECVNRIRLIRHFQRSHRLSLAEIARLLEKKERGDDLSVYLELNDIIFGSTQDDHRLLDEAKFCQATGLNRQQMKALIHARLLLPTVPGRFDQEDVNVGKSLASNLERGVKIQDMTYYVELGEKIVDHEMAFRRRLTHHLPYQEDASFTVELVRRARMMRTYVIDRLFQHRVAAMRDLKEGEESDEPNS